MRRSVCFCEKHATYHVRAADCAPCPAQARREIDNVIFHFPQKFGKFELLKSLGHGGLGAVFLSSDPETKAKVALKIFWPDLWDNVDACKQFLAKLEYLSKLSYPLGHAHIAQAIRVGVHESVPYCVSEYFDGTPMVQLLTQRKKLRAESVREIILQVCAGLEEIHATGMIHGNLKSGNVLIGHHQDKLSVNLTDFGISLLEKVGGGLTVAQGVGGTALFMAPEQLEAGDMPVDRRADIYSLGVVLYNMVTGKLPLGTWHPLSEEAPFVLEAFPNVDHTLHRMLEHDPGRRPANVKEVTEELSKPPKIKAGPVGAPAAAAAHAPASAAAGHAPAAAAAHAPVPAAAGRAPAAAAAHAPAPAAVGHAPAAVAAHAPAPAAVGHAPVAAAAHAPAPAAMGHAPAAAAAPAHTPRPGAAPSADAIPESWRLDPNYRAMLSTMAIYELDKAGTGAGVISHPSLKLLLRQRAFQPLFQQKGFSEVMLRPEFKGFLDRLGSRMKLAKVMRVIRAVIWWLGFVGLGVLVYFKTESLPLMTKLSDLIRKLPVGKLKENVFVWFPRGVWFGVAILVLWILLWLLFMAFMRVKYGFCPTCDQFGFLRGNICSKCGKSLRGLS